MERGTSNERVTLLFTNVAISGLLQEKAVEALSPRVCMVEAGSQDADVMLCPHLTRFWLSPHPLCVKLGRQMPRDACGRQT